MTFRKGKYFSVKREREGERERERGREREGEREGGREREIKNVTARK